MASHPADAFIDAIAERTAEKVLARLPERLPKEPGPAPEWFTLTEGAEYAKRSYSIFTTAVRNRELPAYQASGRTMRGARVKRRDIDEWLESSPY